MLEKRIVLPIPSELREGTLAWDVAHELIHEGHVVEPVFSPSRKLVPYCCKLRLEVNARRCNLYDFDTDGRRFNLDNKQDVFAHIVRDRCVTPSVYYVLTLSEIGRVLQKTFWLEACIDPHALHWAPYRNAWHLLR